MSAFGAIRPLLCFTHVWLQGAPTAWEFVKSGLVFPKALEPPGWFGAGPVWEWALLLSHPWEVEGEGLLHHIPSFLLMGLTWSLTWSLLSLACVPRPVSLQAPLGGMGGRHIKL